MNLLLTLPLNPRIPRATLPLLILPRQQYPCNNTPTKQKQRQIRQHNPMPKFEPRFILRAVNIRAHHAIEVSPPDNEAERDTALVHAFEVVGRPGDGVRDAGVDAHGAEERACVLDAWRAGAEEHGEAYDAEEGHDDVAETALLGAICDPADEDGANCCYGVGWDGEQVCSRRGVAELL